MTRPPHFGGIASYCRASPLDGPVEVITGCTGGIGYVIATALGGAMLVLSGFGGEIKFYFLFRYWTGIPGFELFRVFGARADRFAIHIGLWRGQDRDGRASNFPQRGI
jgi:hypothetical protein